jgi:hypothetical protein
MVVRPESGLAQAGKYFGNLILRILRPFFPPQAFVHRVSPFMQSAHP